MKMRIAHQDGPRRASMALVLAVIAVAAMPAFAGLGSELLALLRDLASSLPAARF